MPKSAKNQAKKKAVVTSVASPSPDVMEVERLRRFILVLQRHRAAVNSAINLLWEDLERFERNLPIRGEDMREMQPGSIERSRLRGLDLAAYQADVKAGRIAV